MPHVMSDVEQRQNWRPYHAHRPIAHGLCGPTQRQTSCHSATAKTVMHPPTSYTCQPQHPVTSHLESKGSERAVEGARARDGTRKCVRLVCHQICRHEGPVRVAAHRHTGGVHNATLDTLIHCCLRATCKGLVARVQVQHTLIVHVSVRATCSRHKAGCVHAARMHTVWLRSRTLKRAPSMQSMCSVCGV